MKEEIKIPIVRVGLAKCVYCRQPGNAVATYMFELVRQLQTNNTTNRAILRATDMTIQTAERIIELLLPIVRIEKKETLIENGKPLTDIYVKVV